MPGAIVSSARHPPAAIAAGVLNTTRQTGSVLGVALFGSLIGQSNAFMTGAHASLVISALLLSVAALVIWRGAAQATT